MNKSKRNILIVNCITALRAIGAVCLIPIFLNFGAAATGLAFLAFICTDWVDGLCARKLHASTFFGAMFDGMIDKLFAFIALVILASVVPGMIIPLGLEFAILGVGLHSALKGNTAKSSLVGKAKVFVMALCAGIGFVVSDYATVQSVVNFIKLPNLTAEQIKMILMGASVTASLSEATALGSYIQRDIEETKSKVDNSEMTLKEKLCWEKKQLEMLKENRVSNQEIKSKLFSPEFYQEHKNDDVKKLLLRKD